MSDRFDDAEDREYGEPAATVPLPRENPDLVGQGGAETVLLDAYRSGRLPHAWLLTGPRGIGKATLAFRFARFLFQQSADGGGLFAAPPTSLAVDPSAPVFRRVASGGHADLLLIERGYDPKRKRYRGEIVVDDVRTIGEFLHLTPAEGGWRIVIVDGADEMNRNAANALLKVLEEPSERALLLITGVSAGRLLPTIRSRCRHLAMMPIADPQLAALLAKCRPDLNDQIPGLLRLANGSIGRALELAAAGGLGLYRELLGLIAASALDGGAIDAFADRLGRFNAEDSFRLVAELLPDWLARMVTRAAAGQGGALPEESAAWARLGGTRAGSGVDRWAELWEKLNRLFDLVDTVNLDRKQAILNAFFALDEASRGEA
jgi:DNA polymerase III subunit delta'